MACGSWAGQWRDATLANRPYAENRSDVHVGASHITSDGAALRKFKTGTGLKQNRREFFVNLKL
jgi:hypothetical protein